MNVRANSNKVRSRIDQRALDGLIASVGGPRQVEDIYPLSATQQGLLFHSLYAPDTAVYVISVACRLEGDLDAGALQRAWQLAIGRHAVLRSAFVGQDLDAPLQVVLREAVLPFAQHDWRTLSGGERETRFAKLQQDERTRSFDFAKPPLMRLALVRMADCDYRLVWNSHHILFDGWSIPLLLNDVFSAYTALSRREIPKFAPVRPFRDYIGWLQRQDLGAAEAYWRKRLAGFDTPNALLLERPQRDAMRRDHQAEVRHELGAPLGSLEQFARHHKLTVNTLMQATWALLLGRYTGSDDVVFGVTVSGRAAELPDIERAVGLFVNTLPLRIALPANESVLDWLREVQRRQTELLAHQYTPLPLLQRWSEVADGTPLFDSIVAFENYPADMSAAADLAQAIRITDVQSVERTSYPLTLQIVVEKSISLKLIYDAERFAAAAIEQLIANFARLLDQIVANPERVLPTLSALSESEHRRFVTQQIDTSAYRQPECCMSCLPPRRSARLTRSR